MELKEYTVVITQKLTDQQLSIILDFLDGLIDPDNIIITVTDNATQISFED